MTEPETIFARLMAVLESRCRQRPAGSYTTRLVDGGVEAIGAKVLEEAGELVEAAGQADRSSEDVVHEAADLVYHLLVMMAYCGVSLGDLEAELARRFGTSGLDEKASRREEDHPPMRD